MIFPCTLDNVSIRWLSTTTMTKAVKTRGAKTIGENAQAHAWSGEEESDEVSLNGFQSDECRKKDLRRALQSDVEIHLIQFCF